MKDQRRSFKVKFILFLIIGSSISLFSQGVELIGPQKIPNDKAAETTAKRWAYMSANRLWQAYWNDTQLTNYPAANRSVWPKGSGINYNDGTAVIVQSHFYVDANGVPLSPGTTPNFDNGDRHEYFAQTGYKEYIDQDVSGKFFYNFYPVADYLNLNQEKPAMNDDPNSWPFGGWPDAPDFVDTTGVTEWNGYFGRGKSNADQEAYFVVNDAWDLEYQRKITDPNKAPFLPGLGPLPGTEFERGGLGIRVGTRLFQWIHPLVQDAQFMHYNVANISKYNIDSIVVAFYIDTGIGSDNSDDLSYMDPLTDMSWLFDRDGVGLGGVKVGIMAFGFLESPGIYSDSKDNDDDGITDEKRFVPEGVVPEWKDDPLDGLSDPAAFEAFYGRAPVPHWDTDENQNWQAWTDLNNNGVFDADFDIINDDVGSDGVSSNDPNYYGPDDDDSEANGIPDDGEPNYNKTDKDESDQIGLTAFHAWSSWSYSERQFQYEDIYWELNARGEFVTTLTPWEGTLNLKNCFASGIIPLDSWRQERFSMVQMHTWDDPGKNRILDDVPLLFTMKKTVQRIYNTSYQFAKPPNKPKLLAIPGDGKVTLVWDDKAESSVEPFFNNIKDFEGYKIYRSTEPFFEDNLSITDSYGSPVLRKPIAQFDLDDEWSGLATWGLYNGVAYNMGDNSGLEHIFVDHDVLNGRTYYYALCAYDFGKEDAALGPVENTATITLDLADNVDFIDKNVAVVVPQANAAGYIPSEIDSNWVVNEGSGEISLKIEDPSEVREDTEYKFTFTEKRDGYDPETAFTKYGFTDDKIFTTETDSVFIVANGDTLYRLKMPEMNHKKLQTVTLEVERFDGMKVSISNTPEELESYYWEDPATDIALEIKLAQLEWGVNVSERWAEIVDVPWDYSIHFVEDAIYTSNKQKFGNIDGENLLPEQKIDFYVLNHNFFHKIFDGVDSVLVPDTATVSIVDGNQDGKYEWKGGFLTDYIKIGELKSLKFGVYAYDIKFFDQWPAPGQVLYINTKPRIRATDVYTFKNTKTIEFDLNTAKEDMKKIKVVPNPYRGTNIMEPNVRQGLNQRRRLMFTRIPANCTISIYTLNGKLIDTINVDNPPSDGKVIWDMRTNEGLEISYGLYLYRVKAPGIDEKMGKFAVIK